MKIKKQLGDTQNKNNFPYSTTVTEKGEYF